MLILHPLLLTPFAFPSRITSVFLAAAAPAPPAQDAQRQRTLPVDDERRSRSPVGEAGGRERVLGAGGARDGVPEPRFWISDRKTGK